MSRPKLILLYGFAGIGKSTIAAQYIDRHPLAMNLEGDRLIVTMGQWLQYEDEARELVFELSKSMAATHLASGHDIVIPYLLTNPQHAKEFEGIAREAGAEFIEIVLEADREETIQRLLKRGTWGEEGTDPITESELPVIEKLYEDMKTALTTRDNARRITVVEGRPDSAYKNVLQLIEEAKR